MDPNAMDLSSDPESSNLEDEDMESLEYEEGSENSEDGEISDYPEDREVSENSENSENSGDGEISDYPEDREVTENSEDMENLEDMEDSEDSEDSGDSMDLDSSENEGIVQASALLQSLPVEIVFRICQYLGQSSGHSLLRTCRALFWIAGPIVWRKVILAPSVRWVNFTDNDINTPTYYRNVGQVGRGFIRSMRLVQEFMAQDGLPDTATLVRWKHLKYCRELTVCEVMPKDHLEVLYLLFPNAQKTNIYMGNFLHWYADELDPHGAGYNIIPHDPGPEPEQYVPAAMGFDRGPRMLCESIANCLDNNGYNWNALNITHLNIDCEAHLMADYDDARYHFVDQLYATFRSQNHNMSAWFTCFPNLQTLTCGTWFLELLWSACYLQNLTRGRRRTRPDDAHMRDLRDRGIGGLVRGQLWTNLHTITVMAYEDEHPELMYRRDRSIITPHIWTFLGVFMNLRKIRAKLGAWKRCHRYPGGFDIAPHIESLETLAALHICQRNFQWDVQIEEFMINLRDIESISVQEPQGVPIDELQVPPRPFIRTSGDLARLLSFIGTIGWNGYVSVPDSTDWWNGPSWKWWTDAPQPPDPHYTSDYFPGFANPTNDDFIRWEFVVNDNLTTANRILFETYVGAINWFEGWQRIEKGLHIYHESCWYRHYLPPRYRYIGTAAYNEQFAIHLATMNPRVKALALVTNNWDQFEDTWLGEMSQEITEVCFDGFDYKLRDILVPVPDRPDLIHPRFRLMLHHSRNANFDFLENMTALQKLTIVNFQWAFDPDTAGPSDEPGSGFDVDTVLQQRIEDFPDESQKLQKLKLVGDIYFRVPPGWGSGGAQSMGNREEREAATNQVLMSFKNFENNRHKIDLEWIRFKYVRDAAFKQMESATGFGRTKVLFPRNDLPAFGFNIYPTWETWDEIDMFEEVETKGWKVYPESSGYPVIMDSRNITLMSGHPLPRNLNSIEERLQAWSTTIHPEKDVPFEPYSRHFCRWHHSVYSRFRTDPPDFYGIHAFGHM